MIASREYVKDLITKVLKSVGFKKENNKYSTDEIIVGQWIDGKPIYRRVYDITSYVKTSTSSYIPISIENFEECVNLTGYIINDNYYHIPANCYFNNNYYFPLAYAEDGLQFAYGGFHTPTKVIAILEYTKTTD